jgi:hypothetical protein
MALGVRLSRTHGAKTALDLVRPLEVGQETTLRKLHSREHPLEAAAVGQRTHVTVDVQQIEPDKPEVRQDHPLQVARRRVPEHAENVEPRPARRRRRRPERREPSEVQPQLLQERAVARVVVQRFPGRFGAEEDQPAAAQLIGSVKQVECPLQIADRGQNARLVQG